MGVVNGLQAQGFDPGLCVVSRFISVGMTDFMAALWKPGRGVYMEELDLTFICSNFTTN